jgi:predicted small secreted protein
LINLKNALTIGGLAMQAIVKNLFLGTLVFGFTLLAGCENTVSGFGKDMQTNGQKIEKSADS